MAIPGDKRSTDAASTSLSDVIAETFVYAPGLQAWALAALASPLASLRRRSWCVRPLGPFSEPAEFRPAVHG
jgi:hypothetical protein